MGTRNRWAASRRSGGNKSDEEKQGKRREGPQTGRLGPSEIGAESVELAEHEVDVLLLDGRV